LKGQGKTIDKYFKYEQAKNICSGAYQYKFDKKEDESDLNTSKVVAEKFKAIREKIR
jgi:hypothetical protein